MDLSLIIPSLIAGVLTFLAPCTLPLVPGYLGFISGVSVSDFKDQQKLHVVRVKVFKNGLFFTFGFSFVFIVLGTLAGFVGVALVPYRLLLSRLAGVFVILFGLFMLKIVALPSLSFLYQEKRFKAQLIVSPGNPGSSFVFGAAFGFGWTPCVGPILGTVLLLASTSTTALQGTFLLTVFSLGLAIPFLLVALGVGAVAGYLKKVQKYLRLIENIGGIFIIFLGILIISNKFSAWISFFYQLFRFINYDRLLNYL